MKNIIIIILLLIGFEFTVNMIDRYKNNPEQINKAEVQRCYMSMSSSDNYCD